MHDEYMIYIIIGINVEHKDPAQRQHARNAKVTEERKCPADEKQLKTEKGESKKH